MSTSYERPSLGDSDVVVVHVEARELRVELSDAALGAPSAPPLA
jgi:hypothetical protein